MLPEFGVFLPDDFEKEALVLSTVALDISSLPASVDLKRFTSVLDSLGKQGVTLDQKLVQAILESIVQIAQKFSGGLHNSNLIELRGKLYPLHPYEVVTAWQNLTGLSWTAYNLDFDGRFEGVLASLRWLVKHELQSLAERERTAQYYWDRQTEIQHKQPCLLGDKSILRWWDEHLASEYTFAGQVKPITPSATAQGWGRYLEEHTDVYTEIELLSKGEDSKGARLFASKILGEIRKQ